jgi:uncharacterized repeat protein (TIGR03803 family)
MARFISLVFVLCLAIVIMSPAQKFKTLVSFDGNWSLAPLVQGLDGNLYSTTVGDTFFTMTPSGALTSLQIVAGGPNGALAQTPQGNFYGTTQGGDGGTIFKVTPTGELTLLYKFCTQGSDGVCPDGSFPQGGVVLATDGDLYGTTTYGGVTGDGTVFKITPKGVLTTLYSFSNCSECTGTFPIAGLVQAADGNFYGTASGGGSSAGCGTVFKMTSGGVLTTLHSFVGTDGAYPSGGLIQAPNGNFYGTTVSSVTSGDCGVFNYVGTVFEITPAGTLTTLYTFCSQTNCTDGAGPSTGLLRATDGNFYGTTEFGGANNLGTIFKITPDGALTTLHSFSGSDGQVPDASLFQSTNGVLYGTTLQGACTGGTCGTIFSLDVGLGEFVETLPTSGAVGKTIDILSQGLTGTTAVSFNGIAASFTVVSDTYLTATVPTGATTGVVTVATPSATLKSNQKFIVVP